MSKLSGFWVKIKSENIFKVIILSTIWGCLRNSFFKSNGRCIDIFNKYRKQEIYWWQQAWSIHSCSRQVFLCLKYKLNILFCFLVFYVSFIVTPLCSNASEIVSSLIFAYKRRKESSSMTYSQVQLIADWLIMKSIVNIIF